MIKETVNQPTGQEKSVAFRYLREQIARDMASVYSAFHIDNTKTADGATRLQTSSKRETKPKQVR